MNIGFKLNILLTCIFLIQDYMAMIWELAAEKLAEGDFPVEQIKEKIGEFDKQGWKTYAVKSVPRDKTSMQRDFADYTGLGRNWWTEVFKSKDLPGGEVKLYD